MTPPRPGFSQRNSAVRLRWPAAGPRPEGLDRSDDRLIGPRSPRTPGRESAQDRAVIGGRSMKTCRPSRVVLTRCHGLPPIAPGHQNVGRRDSDLVIVVRVMGRWDHPGKAPTHGGSALALLLVEEIETHRGEEPRGADVVVGQAGQDGKRMAALRPALAHPAAVAEAAVEEL